MSLSAGCCIFRFYNIFSEMVLLSLLMSSGGGCSLCYVLMLPAGEEEELEISQTGKLK